MCWVFCTITPFVVWFLPVTFHDFIVCTTEVGTPSSLFSGGVASVLLTIFFVFTMPVVKLFMFVVVVGGYVGGNYLPLYRFLLLSFVFRLYSEISS